MTRARNWNIGEPGRIGDLRDAVDARSVDVPEGVVGEQIPHGSNPEFAVEEPGPGLPDPGDVLYVIVEYLHGDKDSER